MSSGNVIELPKAEFKTIEINAEPIAAPQIEIIAPK